MLGSLHPTGLRPVFAEKLMDAGLELPSLLTAPDQYRVV